MIQQAIKKKFRMEEMFMQTQQQMQTQHTSMQNLGYQINQLASALKINPSGRFPRDTQMPRMEDGRVCKVVELRNGKKLLNPYKKLELGSKEVNGGQCTKTSSSTYTIQVCSKNLISTKFTEG